MDLPAPAFLPAQSIDPSFLPKPSPFEVCALLCVCLGHDVGHDASQPNSHADSAWLLNQCLTVMHSEPQGAYSPNDRLTNAVRVFEGKVNGSGAS